MAMSKLSTATCKTRDIYAKLLRDNSFCLFVMSYTCNSAACMFSSYLIRSLIMSCPLLHISLWSVWGVGVVSMLWLWRHLLPCRRLKFSSQGQGSHHAARGSGFQPQGLGKDRSKISKTKYQHEATGNNTRLRKGQMVENGSIMVVSYEMMQVE